MEAGGDIGEDGALAPVEVRALLNVALDLADDLGVACAVVVVDRAGVLRGAERPGTVAGEHLDRAIEGARAVLEDGGREIAAPGVGALPLHLGGVTRGALAVAGGPDGFAVEACHAAARALGLGPGGPAAVAA